MRALLLCAAVAGCGDNLLPRGPALEHADTVFIAAHTDDDLIFMQPELQQALRGSVATIYVATGDPLKGLDHARALFAATREAYTKIADVTAWDCGYVDVGEHAVYHCRAANRDLSLVCLDVVDGGLYSERTESLLHLVDGTVDALPVLGAAGGTVTVDSMTDLVAQVLAALAPHDVQTLELAGTHGRDHSSHMFASAFTLWAMARVGYAGPVTWHRGYNVELEPVTLTGPAFAAAATMLGYYEACAGTCGTCGSPCTTLPMSHDTWIRRQHSVARVLGAGGRLVDGDACITADLALGDCAVAPTVSLTADGQLRIGDRCIASTADGAAVLTACGRDPAQYWVLDGDGFLWNGGIPAPGGDMSYTHVRCLDSALGTPACGDLHRSTWRFDGDPLSAGRDTR